MKIRTDFVTNSSSSSFVAYRIYPDFNDKDFPLEIWKEAEAFLDMLYKKYRPCYDTDGLWDGDLNISDTGFLEFEVLTSGVSGDYIEDILDGDYESEEEQQEDLEFTEMHCGSGPAPIETVIATYFGPNGTEHWRYTDIGEDDYLFDEEKEIINPKISTYLTKEEARRLQEIFELLESYTEKEESIGNTD